MPKKTVSHSRRLVRDQSFIGDLPARPQPISFIETEADQSGDGHEGSDGSDTLGISHPGSLAEFIDDETQPEDSESVMVKRRRPDTPEETSSQQPVTPPTRRPIPAWMSKSTRNLTSLFAQRSVISPVHVRNQETVIPVSGTTHTDQDMVDQAFVESVRAAALRVYNPAPIPSGPNVPAHHGLNPVGFASHREQVTPSKPTPVPQRRGPAPVITDPAPEPTLAVAQPTWLLPAAAPAPAPPPGTWVLSQEREVIDLCSDVDQ